VDDVRQLAGMNPERLAELRQWLLDSDKRDFAAVVIRRGYIALEVERGNSASTDSRRVASVSKAVCATVLAIASEQSQRGLTPKKMRFDDPAFPIHSVGAAAERPAQGQITVKQLLNHTSGICPEATGARRTMANGNTSLATLATRVPRSWRSVRARAAAIRLTRWRTPLWFANR
jgi:CubicO group peptidase (beta-lactamase class C family)